LFLTVRREFKNKLKLRYIATKNLWLEAEVWHTAASVVFGVGMDEADVRVLLSF